MTNGTLTPNQLRQVLDKSGLTMAELARQMGLPSYHIVSKWVNGQRSITAPHSRLFFATCWAAWAEVELPTTFPHCTDCGKRIAGEVFTAEPEPRCAGCKRP